MKQLLLCVFLFSIHLLAAQSNVKIVGYFPTYRFSYLPDIHLERCTHVNIAFANPDAQGNLTTEGINITPVVTAAKQAGCQVFISLAGGYLTPAWESAWNQWLLPANRPAYIQKIVQYVLDHNLDGVDVDLEWQYVNSYYSPFVIELKNALHAQNKMITAALPGSHRYPQITNEALAAFDWVNMMVYDLRGPWDPGNPGQHSPYSWAVQCIQYWENQGMAPSKLTLGVPFYGYDFSTSPVSSFTYRAMVALNTDYAWLDQVGQRWYNGIPTIQAKTQLALDEGLSGIMIWELGQDVLSPSLQQYSLLKAIYETVNPASGTSAPVVEALPLFPNPATQWVQLPPAERVELYDLQGRLIKQDSGAGAEPVTLDISALPQGLYLIQAWTDGVRRNGRLVKG